MITTILAQPLSNKRFGDMLQESFIDNRFQLFEAAIAFVKRSGVKHIEQNLKQFLERGGKARIVVGIDQYGTSYEGLANLLEAVNENEIWIYHADRAADRYYTFHPKLYVFQGENFARIVIGSGNLTEGGLFTNDEAFVILELSLPAEQSILDTATDAIAGWRDQTLDAVKRLDAELLETLLDQDYIRKENIVRTEDEAESEGNSTPDGMEDISKKTKRTQSLFGQGIHRRTAPTIRRPRTVKRKRPVITESSKDEPQADLPLSADWFAIAVIHRDLWRSNSSPEISLTKGIRDVNPKFWGWPDKFSDADNRTQYTRDIVVLFKNQRMNAYLKDFPAHKPDGTKASSDFRIGAISPIVHNLQSEGDIVILEVSDQSGIDYIARVINITDEEYLQIRSKLIPYSKSKSRSGAIKQYYYSTQ